MTVELFTGEGSFRSVRVILHPRGDFAGHFTGHFAAMKLECRAAKWHPCAKGVFRKGCLGCEMKLWRISQLVSQLRNGTRVPEECFAAAKIFAGGLGLRNDFAEEGLFCSKTSIL